MAWCLIACATFSAVLQLWIQYRLNFWSRDFFNAVEHKSAAALASQALDFLPLAAASLLLTALSIWCRMTTEREWRRWLSTHLYDYWLNGSRHAQLESMAGDHQAPEYRIAEDARVATDLPVDLCLGLLSSILTAVMFIDVLWSVGGAIEVQTSWFSLSIPGYLVVAAVAYSVLLTSATFIINRKLSAVIEQNKSAEADLKAVGSRAAAIGQHNVSLTAYEAGRLAIETALDRVIVRWRILCWHMMRMALLTQTNTLIAPSLGLLVCAPKYLLGQISLGAMVQVSAAFVAVQSALSWSVDNYGRLAEWISSANRVASLLMALDRANADAAQRQITPRFPVARQPSGRVIAIPLQIARMPAATAFSRRRRALN